MQAELPALPLNLRGMLEPDEYSSAQVCHLAGVTMRQLQWWDERNVLCPRQEGHRRIYTAGQLRTVKVINDLRQKGFPLQRVRRILRNAIGAPDGGKYLAIPVHRGRLPKWCTTEVDALVFALVEPGPVYLVEVA